MTFGYFGGPDCETCGGYYPGNPNAMPSHFCDCKPIWQIAEELYAGRVSVHFREENLDGTIVAEGKFVSDPSHAWHRYVKKLANYPAVEFEHEGRKITVSRMAVCEFVYLFDDE